MCGIAGFYQSFQQSYNSKEVIRSMTDSIRHRGPDNSDFWISPEKKMVFGHRRLSVLDLSASGTQPMLSACETLVLSFNGEIYNHKSLRQQLLALGKAPVWHGHSDTETLLACFAAWGVAETLRSAVGMFAISLWDLTHKTITLARDRLGEKPLYWGWSNNVFLFGSELKSLKTHPLFDAEIDRNSLTLLLRYGYIPAPFSIYRGIHKLLPGHFLQIPFGSLDLSSAKTLLPTPYWSINEAVSNGLASQFEGTATDAVDAVEHQLGQSVQDQMLSDVPLGAFLSGGIDSSLIVSIMQAQTNLPVRSFTIGFEEKGFNEAEHAMAVARHLGTQHTEIYVQPNDALSVIPQLPQMFCEPFSDSSQIPTFLVSQMAKQHVTVALSGDGGDEIFGGYNRYIAAQKIWKPAQNAPLFVRKALAGGLNMVPPARWDQLFDILKPVLPRSLQLSIPGEKARKLSAVLSTTNGKEYYCQLISCWSDPNNVVLGGVEPITKVTDYDNWPSTDCLEHSMMAMDLQTYLADDILCKVDRAAMANSLEVRVPMLDHRVVELAWKMPLEFKIRDGKGKWLLRQILYKHVPKELVERPKAGFGIPLDSWLRGTLKEWAEELLNESRLIQEGFFNPEPIRTMWIEHLSGKKNWQYHLWNILMFQAWLEQQ